MVLSAISTTAIGYEYSSKMGVHGISEERNFSES
jgi:hypothetical protein